MIVHLDASALVKRYVAEPGSLKVEALIGEARATGTAVLGRAEVSAALAENHHRLRPKGGVVIGHEQIIGVSVE